MAFFTPMIFITDSSANIPDSRETFLLTEDINYFLIELLL